MILCTRQERENTAKDGRHDGSVENAVVRLDESIETIAVLKMRKVNVVVDGGCV